MAAGTYTDTHVVALEAPVPPRVVARAGLRALVRHQVQYEAVVQVALLVLVALKHAERARSPSNAGNERYRDARRPVVGVLRDASATGELRARLIGLHAG